MFQYDVFLSHASADKPAVEKVARMLRDEHGLRVFFDRWELVPGTHWQDALQDALAGSRTCAIFLGPEDLGPWHTEEMRVALGQRVAEEPKRVIPVLLPGAQESAVPGFLAQRTWVDLRSGLDDGVAFERLTAGIRGTAPVPGPPAPAPCADPSRETPPRPQPSTGQASSSWWRRSRPLNLGISIGLLGALLTTLAWISPWVPTPPPAHPFSSPSPELYALRVQVFDPDGRAVDGSTVRVSSGNEPHRLPDGWWQVEIPRAKLPLDGQITVWAEHPQWDDARQDLQLRKDPNPRAELRLAVPRERIAGVVVDTAGRSVGGARLSVRDPSGSTATTNREGWFELWVTAARNERARLHIEHADFPPQDGSCYAGRDGCALVLAAER